MTNHNAAESFQTRYLLILVGCSGFIASFLMSTPHVHHFAEIEGYPIFAEQYQTEKKIAEDFLEMKLDKTEFIHRQLLIHAAKRHGYEVTPIELKRFIQEAPFDFRYIFTATDAYESASSIDTRQKAQKFAINSILENKMRDKLLIPKKEPTSIEVPIKLKVIPFDGVHVKPPTGIELYRYYCDNVEKYKLEQYKIRIKKVDHTTKFAPEALEKGVEELYLKSPQEIYLPERRDGYIVKCFEQKTNKLVLKSLQQSNLLPISLKHCIMEQILNSYEYGNDNPYSQALFKLDLKNKYYTVIGPSCYLVLSKVIPSHKMSFKRSKTEYLMDRVLNERKQDLNKQNQVMLENSSNISNFLNAQSAATITIDAVNQYSHFEPIVAFLKKNQESCGIVRLSENVDFVFELIAKSFHTPSFKASLPQVKHDYLVAAKDLLVQTACKQGKVLSKPPVTTQLVSMKDMTLPETVRLKMLAAPSLVIDYEKSNGDYYIFQKLSDIKIEQIHQTDPMRELAVLKTLKHKYNVKIAKLPEPKVKK